MSLRLTALAALLVWSCEPPAPSPLEPMPDRPEAATAAQACLAVTYPILVQSIQLPGSELALTKADASSGVILASGGNFHGAVWSPDGRSIAFRHWESASLADAVAGSSVELITPDGGERLELTSDSSPPADGISVRFPDGPTWSPDGRSLAFASQAESDHWRVWMMSRSGGQLRLLLPQFYGPHFYPSWAPRDAAQLVFVGETAGLQDLFLVDPSTESAPTNLTEGRVVRPEAPRWSPDGNRLAFSAEAASSLGSAVERNVYVLELTSLALTRVTAEGINVQPIWAPDGESLIVASTRGRAEEALQGFTPVGFDLWSVPLDTGAARQLTEGAQSRSASDWYPEPSCSGDR